MKPSILGALVAGMLVFGATSASAYAITATTSYDGRRITASETITFDIWLDTEGESNIRLISLGMVFDNTQLAYDEVNSAAEGYMLYSPASGATPSRWLEPAIPGGASFNPPQLILPDQVAINMIEVSTRGTIATATNAHMATLIFHVGNPTGGFLYSLWLTIDGSRGGTFFVLDDNSQPPVTTRIVFSPEPTTALLIGLGLVGLGVVARSWQAG